MNDFLLFTAGDSFGVTKVYPTSCPCRKGFVQGIADEMRAGGLQVDGVAKLLVGKDGDKS
ncbi:hypothetical protein SAMN05216567_1349 [Variovorax sp. OK605]|uniref:hypothetical protein n=1 Tax=Variovorax sp. OK605 TaxID=1855317 RepID=UPI0008F2D8A3|nr:hypothetical protein [Variovorax sp. OK605]SFQ73962.1 hypothetical protein SAMN05216567_1349 [Variovorax sp. OK605]